MPMTVTTKDPSQLTTQFRNDGSLNNKENCTYHFKSVREILANVSFHSPCLLQLREQADNTTTYVLPHC